MNKIHLALAMSGVLAMACTSTGDDWASGSASGWGSGGYAEGGYDPGDWGWTEAGSAPQPEDNPCWWESPGACPAGDASVARPDAAVADAGAPVDASITDDDAGTIDDDAGTVDDDAGTLDDDAGTDAGQTCRRGRRRRDGGCR